MEVSDIARAINCPWFPVPEGSKYSLRELREVRWDMATRAERGEALNAALAVHAEIAKYVVAHDALVAALTGVRAIISDAAMTGFNCFDGDWAERLFASQADTSAALARSSQVERA